MSATEFTLKLVLLGHFCICIFSHYDFHISHIPLQHIAKSRNSLSLSLQHLFYNNINTFNNMVTQLIWYLQKAVGWYDKHASKVSFHWTSCMSDRLCSWILVDPGRYIELPVRLSAWRRDTMSRFWTRLESSAPDPFNCNFTYLFVSTLTFQLTQNRWRVTCLVVAANFSANSTSPFIRGTRQPLPSSASIILIAWLTQDIQ